jgi:hypothetical protein
MLGLPLESEDATVFLYELGVAATLIDITYEVDLGFVLMPVEVALISLRVTNRKSGFCRIDRRNYASKIDKRAVIVLYASALSPCASQ